MILIKLGGSVITDKSRPLVPSAKRIIYMSRAIARIQEPVIIVHGGGSFGHYWSVRYDMHTEGSSYDTKGVAKVKHSMIQLDTIVLERLLRVGTRPYAVPPSSFMAGPNPIASRVKEIESIASSSDMIPVTYGDAIWYGAKDGSNKTYILSGDKIMTYMARILKPRLCIFVLGEDGLYTDMKTKRLVEVVPAAADISAADTKNGAAGVMDVTGGMTRKITEARAISNLGVAVAFVNGNHPKRIEDAATAPVAAYDPERPGFKGTLFEARQNNIKKKNMASAAAKKRSK